MGQHLDAPVPVDASAGYATFAGLGPSARLDPSAA
jgi:hypothetical protein